MSMGRRPDAANVANIDSPWDSEYHLSLSQQPSQSDLTDSDALDLGNLVELVDDLEAFGEVL